MRKIGKHLINREIILYLLFGVMTTIVNFGTYIIADNILGKNYYLISNMFSFIMATVFAFVTNKWFVFESRNLSWKILGKELISFISARIFTFLLIEELGLLLAVGILRVDKIQLIFLDGTLMAKILLAFLAVLLNFILSKCLIFKDKE